MVVNLDTVVDGVGLQLIDTPCRGTRQAYYAESAHGGTEAEARNAAFEKIPVSKFPGLPLGKGEMLEDSH